MKSESFTCDLCRQPIEPFGLGHHGRGITYGINGSNLRLVQCSAREATAHICSGCVNQIAEQKRQADDSDLY